MLVHLAVRVAEDRVEDEIRRREDVDQGHGITFEAGALAQEEGVDLPDLSRIGKDAVFKQVAKMLLETPEAVNLPQLLEDVELVW